MNTSRKTAVIVGALFLVGYLGVFGGGALTGPLLDAPDYLTQIYPNKTQVITGLLIELVNAASVVGIAVALFPIFKQRSESLALGYAGFRVIEAAISVAISIIPLSLINLSQEYIQAGTPAPSYFLTLGDLVLAGRYWAGEFLTVFFILGALIFYYLLYQTKLVPRFISVWGFIATASLAAGNLIGAPGPAEDFNPIQLLFLPIFLSELLVAIWLIVKGFNPSAIAAGSARADVS